MKRPAAPRWRRLQQAASGVPSATLVVTWLLVWLGLALGCALATPTTAAALSLLLPWTVLGGVVLLPRLGLRLPIAVVLVGALVLYALYLTYTSCHERTYDAAGHLYYVRHLVEQHRLPASDGCHVCHHPPLYYGLAAPVYAACRATALPSPEVGLQLLSLALMVVFAVFAALTLVRVPATTGQQTLAVALVVFWPSSIRNSVRVNNDALLYALVAAGLYFALRWHEQHRRGHLWAACALAALAVLTKANGHALVVVLLGLALAHVVRSADRRSAFDHLAGPVVALLVVVAANANLRRDGYGGAAARNLLGAAYKTKPKQLLVDPPGTYTSFSMRSYLRQPFAVAQPGRPAQDGYWSHLLKSSLWGTRNLGRNFERDFAPSPRIAAGANFALLALLAFATSVVLLARRQALRRCGAHLFMVAVFLAMGLGFRISMPTVHHGDFRFIYPLLIPAAALFLWALGTLRRQERVLEAVGWGAASSLIVLSIAYFAPVPPGSVEGPGILGAPPAPAAGVDAGAPPPRRLIDRKALERLRLPGHR